MHDPVDEDAMLAAAEAAVGELRSAFEAALRADLDRIDAAVAAAADPGQRDRRVAEIYTAFHDLKGQAGSFGYGLLTEIAADLCAHLRAAKPVAARDVAIAAAYASAVRQVSEAKLLGDGGATGQQIRADLAAAVGAVP
jgi:chemotaxis protein histidine kinase CheA